MQHKRTDLAELLANLASGFSKANSVFLDLMSCPNSPFCNPKELINQWMREIACVNLSLMSLKSRCLGFVFIWQLADGFNHNTAHERSSFREHVIFIGINTVLMDPQRHLKVDTEEENKTMGDRGGAVRRFYGEGS